MCYNPSGSNGLSYHLLATENVEVFAGTTLLAGLPSVVGFRQAVRSPKAAVHQGFCKQCHTSNRTPPITGTRAPDDSPCESPRHSTATWRPPRCVQQTRQGGGRDVRCSPASRSWVGSPAAVLFADGDSRIGRGLAPAHRQNRSPCVSTPMHTWSTTWRPVSPMSCTTTGNASCGPEADADKRTALTPEATRPILLLIYPPRVASHAARQSVDQRSAACMCRNRGPHKLLSYSLLRSRIRLPHRPISGRVWHIVFTCI
jgi:hypothetical protein